MDYISGVVEGFYGRPWTTEQRKELFMRIEKMGMNSYVYAPKDDLKHRAQWRDLYTVEEADHLQGLITAARECHVRFYYSLSPGLDIMYSNQKEVNTIKQKLDQVKQLGADGFALLFDDIETTMSDQDAQKFSSFAEAQVAVANEVFYYLQQPSFMFCPTEYCESRAVPNLDSSEYLETIGKKLANEIYIMWTGPRVISRLISEEHLEAVGRVFRRRPLIWDNLHANDYDTKRLFMGPYSGRPAAIRRLTAGIVLNPNCEFEANFLPMHTLAQWCRCVEDARYSSDSDTTLLDVDESATRRQMSPSDEANVVAGRRYDPHVALRLAVDDWLPEVAAPRSAFATPRLPPVPAARALSPPLPDFDSSSTGHGSEELLVTTAADASPMTHDITPEPPATTLEGRPASFPAGVRHSAAGLLDLSPAADQPAQKADAVDSSSSPATTTTSDPQQHSNLQQVHAAAVCALNSLTDDYSEPMELAPPSCTLTSAMAEGDFSTSSEHVAAPEAQDGDSRFICGQLNPSIVLEDTSSIMQVDGQESSPPSAAVSNGSPISSAADELRLYTTTMTAAPIAAPTSYLNRRDLELLCGFYYLPFERGSLETAVLSEFVWLRANVSACFEGVDEEWNRRAGDFQSLCWSISELCVKLVGCANRGLVYDLYPYVWELQGLLNCMSAFISWLGSLTFETYPKTGEPFALNGVYEKPSFPKSECVEGEPWLVRGGLTTECQRLLMLENSPDVFSCRTPHPPCGRIFRSRPYRHSDRQHIYEMCRRLAYQTHFDSNNDVDNYNNLDQQQLLTEVVGDRIVGPFLDFSPHLCFVCEEHSPDQRKLLVGFGLATTNIDQFMQNFEKSFLPKMRLKYDDQLRMMEEKDVNRFQSSASALGQLLKELIKSFFALPASPHTGVVDQSSMRTSLTELNYAYFPTYLKKQLASLLCIKFMPETIDTAAPKRLLVPLFAALRFNGTRSAFCHCSVDDRLSKELYQRSGFGILHPVDEPADEREASSTVSHYGRCL